VATFWALTLGASFFSNPFNWLPFHISKPAGLPAASAIAAPISAVFNIFIPALLLTLLRRTRPAHRLHYWNPLVYCGQCRKIRVRLGLIPITNRIEIIGPMICMAVLHGVLHVALKGHRVVGMPAIQAVAAAGAFGRRNQVRSVVEVRERNGAIPAAEIPGAIEVILGTGADDQRFALVVNEDHVIAFAHPELLVLKNAERDSHQMAATPCFRVNIVALAVRILQPVGVAVGPPVIACGCGRSGL